MNKEKIIKDLIASKLEAAESIWDNGGNIIQEALLSFDSKIQKKVADSAVSLDNDQLFIVKPVIAVVVDMRDSTRHLLQSCAKSTHNVNLLKRVFFETSALLPALDKTLSLNNGQVNEYLGDGILGFFDSGELTSKDKKDANHDVIVDNYLFNKAKSNLIQFYRDVMKITLPAINSELFDRYNLPKLKLGIGASFSKVIIHKLGVTKGEYLKAFGSCVFEATRLSSGVNELIVSESIRNRWGSSKQGKVNFKKFVNAKNNIKGFIVNNL